MNLRKRLYLPVFACALFSSPLVIAQHNELSFQFSPKLPSGEKLDKDSPIASLNAFNYARFSTSRLGLRPGFNLGYGHGVRNKENQLPSVNDSLIRHSVFFEAGGSGGVGSINYDRRFKSCNNGWGGRIGLGFGEQFMHEQDGWERYVSIPLMVNYIVGKRRSGLEAGLGIVPEVAAKKPVDDPGVKVLGTFNLGYRLQPLKNGFMLRAAWTPVFNDDDFDASWLGISVGYSFKK